LLPAPDPAALPTRRAARLGGLAAIRGAGCLLALLVASSAAAFQVTSIRPARDGGQQLHVELRLEEPIEPRVASSLQRGMPATLALRAELWRRRNGWFDRLERTVESSFRIRHEVGRERWLLERQGAEALVVSSLDSLSVLLERTLVISAGSLEKLPPTAPCYVVVIASLRPLQLEDVNEVESWLSGEVKSSRSSGGLGILTGIPRSVFDAARNFAGFGDDRSRMISAEFTPANLPVDPR
jgi:hypothetical protein